MDMVDELLEKVNIENKKQIKILEQLDKVEQPFKLLLEKVYIQGKNLVKTADEMHYTYEYTRKIHGIALNKFDEAAKK